MRVIDARHQYKKTEQNANFTRHDPHSTTKLRSHGAPAVVLEHHISGDQRPKGESNKTLQF